MVRCKRTGAPWAVCFMPFLVSVLFLDFKNKKKSSPLSQPQGTHGYELSATSFPQPRRMRADSQSSPSLSHLPNVGLLSVLVIVELAIGHHAHGFTRLLIIYSRSTSNFQTGLSFLLPVRKHDRLIVERKLIGPKHCNRKKQEQRLPILYSK